MFLEICTRIYQQTKWVIIVDYSRKLVEKKIELVNFEAFQEILYYKALKGTKKPTAKYTDDFTDTDEFEGFDLV